MEVDLDAGVAVGLEGGGLGPKPGGVGAAGAADRVVGVVGEHAGGFAPGALDKKRGPLLGDHAGGGERGGVLVGGGQDVEDLADEHPVDAFELAAQDLVAGENLLELAVDGGDGVAVGRVGPEGGNIEKPCSKEIVMASLVIIVTSSWWPTKGAGARRRPGPARHDQLEAGRKADLMATAGRRRQHRAALAGAQATSTSARGSNSAGSSINNRPLWAKLTSPGDPRCPVTAAADADQWGAQGAAGRFWPTRAS